MRQPITLKIKFKSASLDQFIERYSVDVSKGGIFIRTKEPLPVGTNLKFEFQLQDSSQLIAGEGTVVWTREHDPARAGVAPGMGVRFDKLASPSNGVLDQILVEKTRRGEAAVESRFDAGVRVTTGSAPVRRDFDPSGTLTPLPKPTPGFDGAEEEFGQESTRVMQDEVVQRLAEKTREQKEQKAKPDEAFSDEPTRARSAEEIDQLVRESGRESTASDEAVTRQVPVLSSVAPPTPAIEPAKAPLVDSPAAAVEKPSISEPKVEVAAGLATPQVVAATPLEPRSPAQRPQKSSSALPMMFGIGILIAGGIGYFAYSKKDAPPEPLPPTQEQPKQVDPVITKAPDEPKTETPTPTSPTTNTPVVPDKPVGPTIAVTSDPPGASITVDGTAQPAATPTTLEGLDPKKSYEVAVSLKGFHEWTTKLTPKEGGKVEAKLVANEKVVEVSSTPSGADLFLDGKKVGRTPFAIRKLDVGKDHNVEVRHAGFETQARPISASDGWEAKDGKDVLPIALTLAAAPPKPKTPPATTPVAVKHAAKPDVKSTEAGEGKPDEKPPEAKPVADKPEAKPVAEKPEAKPVAEKPEAKPEKKEPKTDDDKAIKTPDFMKGGEGGESQ